MTDQPQPAELAPRVLKDQLLKSCQQHYNETLAQDDRQHDRGRVRDGLLAAEAAIASVEADGALGSYVHRVIVALEHQRAEFLAFDADDPDHWRAGAVRTILRELEHTAGWLLPTAPPPQSDTILVPRDILDLLESQMPLLRALHRRGNLAPIAASMDPDGNIGADSLAAEDLTDSSVETTLYQFARRFGRALESHALRAAGIFFHGHTEDRIVEAAHTLGTANALVAWLQHESGLSVQAVMRYERLVAAEGSEDETWRYGSPVFSVVAVFQVE
jgi:hypothetical protein